MLHIQIKQSHGQHTGKGLEGCAALVTSLKSSVVAQVATVEFQHNSFTKAGSKQELTPGPQFHPLRAEETPKLGRNMSAIFLPLSFIPITGIYTQNYSLLEYKHGEDEKFVLSQLLSQ